MNLISHYCPSLPTQHCGDWNPASQSEGDGWRECCKTMWMRKSTATMEPRDMRLKKLQLVIDEQSPITARTLRTPEPPTDAARMAHNATHVPFRDWCPFCVANRGRSSPHRRVVVNKTADTLPKFQTDYMFIRPVAESKTQPCITFVETRSGSGDHLHVRSEGWLLGLDEGNPATF